MGNSNSTKVRTRSDSMTIRYKEPKPPKESDSSFSKSKSMVELGTKTRTKSAGSIRDKPKPTPRDSIKTSNGVSRQKSIRAAPTSHPISGQSREIISQCFENPHSEFGNKVLQRIFEKRSDFQNYVYSLGKAKSYQMSVRLKDLIEEIIAKLYDPDYIQQISKTYGEEHVELKQFGWKPDFWVAIADAITVEGVILDMANHQPADTVAAWSSLVTLMFSSVRDGYYQALRKHRMSSRRVLRRQTTIESHGILEEPSTSTLKQPSPPASLTPTPSVMESSSSNSSQLQTGTGNSSRRTSSLSVESETSNTVTRMNIMAPVVRDLPPTPVNCPVLVTSRSRPIFE